MATPLRVLMAEDSQDDTDLVARELRRAGYDLQLERVQSANALESAWKAQEWDLIIADFSMPQFSGMDALKFVRRNNSDVPFIFVSGTMGEETSVQAMKNGAQDYLIKGNLVRLVPAVQRELRDAEARREYKRLELTHLNERERTNQLLAQQREQLERSNKDLEQFAYAASHDLQEPLRAVAGCVQLLQKFYGGKLDARADEFIAHAVDGCMRMKSLIDDLLAFSRIGHKQDERRMVDSGELLAVALSNLSQSIAETGAKITWDPLPSIQAEAPLLVMLFQNLIGNAIKFRKPEEAPAIHIGWVHNQNGVTISVADNGIGIAPKYFERIFQVFQRLHTRSEYPGTGIGLALCKRIAEYHGGQIWVESVPGEGATFYVTFPLTPMGSS